MENQFVSYEIALKLKEIGFDEPVFATFNYENKPKLREDFIKVSSKLKAPLWQQVIDWFREKYDIHITVEPLYRPQRFTQIKYYYAISTKDNFYGGIDDCLDAWLELAPGGINYHIADTYKEAREQAILKAIELIAQNKNL